MIIVVWRLCMVVETTRRVVSTWMDEITLPIHRNLRFLTKALVAIDRV